MTWLRTPRLILRDWRSTDLEPFAALNADPAVMEHFPAPMTGAESKVMVERIAAHLSRHGYGLWAVEAPGIAPFIGFVGLNRPGFTAAFTPCVEIGWRLATAWWGLGYATEAARAALAIGFEQHGLDEIVSFTTTTNRRSAAVMARLSMTHDPAEDFDHPLVAEGHRLRRHILCRLTRSDWIAHRRNPAMR